MTLAALSSSPARAARTATSYDSIAQDVWAPIRSAGGLRELVRAGTLAANSHNTQPWRFMIVDKQISIRPDLARRCRAVDPDDHHLFASLGCTVENIVQAAPSLGFKAEPTFDSLGGNRVTIVLERAPSLRSDLVAAITQRQCTRAEYDGRAVSAQEPKTLFAAGTMDGVVCLLETERPRMNAILDYVVQGNTAQMRDPAFMAELGAWIRFNDSQAIERLDGLSGRSSGQPSLPGWLARRLLPFVMTEKGENDKYAKHIRSSTGIAVFAAAANDKANWVAAGRAYQRFALQATALDMKHAFINQPLEVGALRPQIAALLGMGDRRPDLMVRFGYGPALPRSQRRPVEAVLDAG
jgi:nitroreductase